MDMREIKEDFKMAAQIAGLLTLALMILMFLAAQIANLDPFYWTKCEPDFGYSSCIVKKSYPPREATITINRKLDYRVPYYSADISFGGEKPFYDRLWIHERGFRRNGIKEGTTFKAVVSQLYSDSTWYHSAGDNYIRPRFRMFDKAYIVDKFL